MSLDTQRTRGFTEAISDVDIFFVDMTAMLAAAEHGVEDARTDDAALERVEAYVRIMNERLAAAKDLTGEITRLRRA